MNHFHHIMKGVVSQSSGVPIPAILNDGNTLFLGDYEKLDTFTLSEGNITEWRDSLGGVTKLTASNGTVPRTSEHVTFGAGILASGDLALGTAFSYYFVLKQTGWTKYRRIYAGSDGSGGASAVNRGACQQYPSAPDLGMYNGEYLLNTEAAIDSWVIKRDIYNGANSRHNINDVLVSGNAGTHEAGGIVLGGYTTTYSSFVTKDIIIRKIADTVEDEALIYAYLKNKYNL